MRVGHGATPNARLVVASQCAPITLGMPRSATLIAKGSLHGTGPQRS